MNKSVSVSLPYPVLGLDGDFKVGGFSVEPSIQLINNELHISENRVTITNEYVNQLYKDGMVTTAYKIVCPSTFYSSIVIEKKDFIIPIELLANHIELEAYLVVKNDIRNYSDESFNEDYFLNGNLGSFSLETKNIIGFAGSMKISLKNSFVKGAAGMFIFSQWSEDYISIETNNDKIEVSYPYEDGELDILTVLSKKKKMTFFSLFIIPALNKAFEELIKANSVGGEIDNFINDHEWALNITESYTDWSNEDTYKSAQLFLNQLLNNNGESGSPLIATFNELNNL